MSINGAGGVGQSRVDLFCRLQSPNQVDQILSRDSEPRTLLHIVYKTVTVSPVSSLNYTECRLIKHKSLSNCKYIVLSVIKERGVLKFDKLKLSDNRFTDGKAVYVTQYIASKHEMPLSGC